MMFQGIPFLVVVSLVCTFLLQELHAFSSSVRHKLSLSSSSSSSSRIFSTESQSSVDVTCNNLKLAFEATQDEFAKTCKVTVGTSAATGRLGLIATKSIRKGDTFLAMPYDDRFMLSADVARKEVFKGLLPDKFEGWTGDAGLIALLILNEVAKAADDNEKNNNSQQGVAKPQRPPAIEAVMKA